MRDGNKQIYMQSYNSPDDAREKQNNTTIYEYNHHTKNAILSTKLLQLSIHARHFCIVYPSNPFYLATRVSRCCSIVANYDVDFM